MTIKTRKQALAQALRDPEELVRSAASRALDRIEGLEKLEQVVEAARSGGKPICIRAIHFLGYLDTAESVDALLSFLQDPEYDIRVAAIKAVQTKLPDKAYAPLLSCLNDPEPSVIQVAMEVLSCFKDQRATEFLLPFLFNKDGEISCTAAEALGRNGDPRAEYPLVKALQQSEDPLLRAKAAEALGRLHPEPVENQSDQKGNNGPSM
jgi:HEAT repeat protein